MKIYRVKVDSNNVQWIIPRMPEGNLLDLLSFDCIPKKDVFNEIRWYAFNPKAKKGNFYTGVSGALIFDEKVYHSELFTLFEMAGEILPFNMETGESLYALNVLECVNSLNENKTIRHIYDDGQKGRILEYSFYENCLSESSIFKIPETSQTEVLTYSGVKNPDDEFYAVYKNSGFTGLVFELLW